MARSEHSLPVSPLFPEVEWLDGRLKSISLWTTRATEHEAMNGRGASLVKETA